MVFLLHHPPLQHRLYFSDRNQMCPQDSAGTQLTVFYEAIHGLGADRENPRGVLDIYGKRRDDAWVRGR